MLRILALLALVSLISASGCGWTWQANHASQAVDINPFNIGSGQQVVSPANGIGYVNGDAMDMRTRH